MAQQNKPQAGTGAGAGKGHGGGHAGAAGGHGHGHGHEAAHSGMGRYIAVWLTLLVFTLITVVTGRMNLGAANIWVAMAIATTKATLVVLFFMHLYDEGGVNRIVFVVSLLFVGVLMLFVFGDLMTRLTMTLPNDGPLPMPPGLGHGSPLPTQPGGH